MKSLALFNALAFLAATQGAAQTVGPTLNDLRVRLASYERQVSDTGRDDPAELGRIASAVIENARRSTVFSVWSEGCASTVTEQSVDCSTRLWSVLKAPRESVSRRATAASALMTLGDTTAAETLAASIKAGSPATLAQLAPIIEKMPAKEAVPLLLRLSESPDPDHQARACEGLSRLDVPESHAGLTKIVDANAPGSPPWLVCMIARARLHEPTPPGAVAGYGNTLQGHGQLFAAKVLFETDPTTSVQLLVDLTHRGTPSERLEVADLLVDVKPDAAIPVVDAAAINPDPLVRADAARLERRLKRSPSKTVRSMLVDADAKVRVRAAEVVIDWAKRSQNR